MVSEKTVRARITPVAEQLIAATVAGDDNAVRALLVPGSEAVILHHLFGYAVFEILLKTILGRDRLLATRAIETEQGRFVHLEFAWQSPTADDADYTAADFISIQLRRYRSNWRVVAVNPAATDELMTEARAHSILAAAQRENGGSLPKEPWILPLALLAGSLRLPLRPEALDDPVVTLLLPGMQQRTYGAHALAGAWRLWQTFKRARQPDVDKPHPWAAAVEFIMSEQTLGETTQAAVGKQYGVGLAAMLPCIRQIKEALAIKGLDARYSPLGKTAITVRDDGAGQEAG